MLSESEGVVVETCYGFQGDHTFLSFNIDLLLSYSNIYIHIPFLCLHSLQLSLSTFPFTSHLTSFRSLKCLIILDYYYKDSSL
jgi:hypothetical protein